MRSNFAITTCIAVAQLIWHIDALMCRQYGGLFRQPRFPIEAATTCKAYEGWCLRLELSNDFYREVRYDCDELFISNNEKLACTRMGCRDFNTTALNARFNWDDIPNIHEQRQLKRMRLCCCNDKDRCEPDPLAPRMQQEQIKQRLIDAECQVQSRATARHRRTDIEIVTMYTAAMAIIIHGYGTAQRFLDDNS